MRRFGTRGAIVKTKSAMSNNGHSAYILLAGLIVANSPAKNLRFCSTMFYCNTLHYRL